jgi:hypothetical protein
VLEESSSSGKLSSQPCSEHFVAFFRCSRRHCWAEGVAERGRRRAPTLTQPPVARTTRSASCLHHGRCLRVQILAEGSCSLSAGNRDESIRREAPFWLCACIPRSDLPLKRKHPKRNARRGTFHSAIKNGAFARLACVVESCRTRPMRRHNSRHSIMRNPGKTRSGRRVPFPADCTCGAAQTLGRYQRRTVVLQCVRYLGVIRSAA